MLLIVDGVEAIENSILAQWLRDSRKTASFSKALRAILATPGRELMLDTPRGIYEDSSLIKPKPSIIGDIWGGSILLSHRIELLSMVLILSIKTLIY